MDFYGEGRQILWIHGASGFWKKTRSNPLQMAENPTELAVFHSPFGQPNATTLMFGNAFLEEKKKNVRNGGKDMI